MGDRPQQGITGNDETPINNWDGSSKSAGNFSRVDRGTTDELGRSQHRKPQAVCGAGGGAGEDQANF